MKHGNAFIGLVVGVLIWAISDISIHQEPLARPALYLAALFVSGLISAFPKPSNWWKGIIGIFVGQWIYIILTSGADVDYPFATRMSLACMLISATGGAIVFGIWKRSKRKTTMNEANKGIHGTR